MPTCWTCTHFAGLDSSRCHVRCAHPRVPGVEANGWTGCAFRERAPGLDDNDQPPEGYRGPMPGVDWRTMITARDDPHTRPG